MQFISTVVQYIISIDSSSPVWFDCLWETQTLYQQPIMLSREHNIYLFKQSHTLLIIGVDKTGTMMLISIDLWHCILRSLFQIWLCWLHQRVVNFIAPGLDIHLYSPQICWQPIRTRSDVTPWHDNSPWYLCNTIFIGLEYRSAEWVW